MQAGGVASAGHVQEQAPAAELTPVSRRQVNDLVRWALDARDPDDPSAFFCECGSEACFQSVWLTIPEYDRSRSRSQWAAVADAHRPAS